MQLFNILLNLQLLIVFVAAESNWLNKNQGVFDSWTQSDLEQYLQDAGLTYKKNSKIDELKKLAINQYDLLPGNHEWSGFLKQKVFKVKEPSKFDDFKDWIFNSWSKQDLYKFIHKNNIHLNHEQTSHILTNHDLIKIIQDHWDEVVNNVKKTSSGKYPGGWLYESWNTISLKKWLKDHGIEYSAKDNRDSLLEKVRQNIAVISHDDYTTSSYKWVKNVANSVKDYVNDKSDSLFSNWSIEDLQKYLKQNKKDIDGNLYDLVSRAKEVYNEQKDISLQSYEKINDEVSKKYEQTTNKISDFQKQLPKYIFDTLSIEDLKLWLKKHGKSTEGSIDELFERAVETYEEFIKNLNPKDNSEYFNSASSHYFSNWSLEDLQNWLLAHKESTEGTFEDLYSRATNKFNEVYAQLVANFHKEKQEKPGLKDAHKNFQHYWKQLSTHPTRKKLGLSTSWYDKLYASIFGTSATVTNPYLVTPNDGIFTRWFKQSASAVRYYILGERFTW